MPLPIPTRRLRDVVLAGPLIAVAAVVAAVSGGCNVIGYAAATLPPPTVDPAIEDMAGKSVAVVVWAAPEVDVSYPNLTRQVGQQLEEILKRARDDGNRSTRRHLEGVTFPYPAQSYVRAFKDRPTLAYEPGNVLAAKCAAELVIYVQVSEFTNRGGAAANLVRGQAEVGLLVYEVDDPIETFEEATQAQATGELPVATEIYREQGILFTFPEDGPEEGSNRLEPRDAYVGLVRLIARGLSKRFVEYQQEPI